MSALVVTPLAPSDIRARRRPSAVVFVALTELVFALVVATPFHAWAGRAWGAHPDGDGVLWQPGGRDLLVWLFQPETSLSIALRTAVVLLVVSAFAMQVPLGGLLASLAFERNDEVLPETRRSLRWSHALGLGITSFLPLAGLLVLALIAGGIILGLGAAAGSAIDHGLAESLGDARSFQLQLAVLALFGVLLALFGVVVDLARAAIVRAVGLDAIEGALTSSWSTLFRGIATGFAVARRALFSASLAWAWRAALACGAIVVGAAISQALGGRGGLSLVVLWIVHQAIVVVRVALRASWLARALTLVAPVQDTRRNALRLPDAPPPATG